MTEKNIYENNPLHGLSLETLLNELVAHYGFEILDAYLNVNCFKKNASIESSVKFLKKTDWAREKVEGFYLYRFKNLPKASGEDFDLPPRDRIVPLSHQPGEPAELSLEDAAKMQANKAKMAAEYSQGNRSPRNHQRESTPYTKKPYSAPKDSRSESRYKETKSDNSNKTSSSESGSNDPWGKWKK